LTLKKKSSRFLFCGATTEGSGGGTGGQKKTKKGREEKVTKIVIECIKSEVGDRIEYYLESGPRPKVNELIGYLETAKYSILRFYTEHEKRPREDPLGKNESRNKTTI